MRDSQRDAVKPVRKSASITQRGRFANQDQEDGLEGVIDVVRIKKPAAADAEDHRAMARQDFLECGLVALRKETLEQLALTQAGERAGTEKRLQVSDEGG